MQEASQEMAKQAGWQVSRGSCPGVKPGIADRKLANSRKKIPDGLKMGGADGQLERSVVWF
jgi:hypothetical protein